MRLVAQHERLIGMMFPGSAVSHGKMGPHVVESSVRISAKHIRSFWVELARSILCRTFRPYPEMISALVDVIWMMNMSGG